MKEAGEQAVCRLAKNERISSKLLIDQLFGGGGSRSMAAFPIRMVYLTVSRAADWPPVKIMVSVPKRCLKHAVERNRVKRQLREAYRQNKQLLWQRMGDNSERTLLLAFIWTDSSLHETAQVNRKMRNLLTRVSEKL
ncbi:MAG: ribonuclease P protein component [Prevotella sp.]|nr:ribonuclease P protein component [Prevotella sp.]